MVALQESKRLAASLAAASAAALEAARQSSIRGENLKKANVAERPRALQNLQSSGGLFGGGDDDSDSDSDSDIPAVDDASDEALERLLRTLSASAVAAIRKTVSKVLSSANPKEEESLLKARARSSGDERIAFLLDPTSKAGRVYRMLLSSEQASALTDSSAVGTLRSYRSTFLDGSLLKASPPAPLDSAARAQLDNEAKIRDIGKRIAATLREDQARGSLTLDAADEARKRALHEEWRSAASEEHHHGGTDEHKRRRMEMARTADDALALTLGSRGKGSIVEIGNRLARAGVVLGGATMKNEGEKEPEETDEFRERMKLAYTVRPNPMNNPRRDYYKNEK